MQLTTLDIVVIVVYAIGLFVLALVLAVVCSLPAPAAAPTNRIQTAGIGFGTSAGFNIGAIGVIVILIALYTACW
jgi:SSS family solute:Na+ symporter